MSSKHKSSSNSSKQQDTSYPGRDDPNVAISEFFNRLDARGGPAHDIWKSIFWLQQRPGDVSADAAYAHGRQAYLAEIQSQVGRVAGRNGPTMSLTNSNAGGECVILI